MVFISGLATVVSTFLGGLFAIRFKDQLHLILGFTAGAVIGVALFDLVPESIGLSAQAHGIGVVTLLIAIGFVLFMMLDRAFPIHLHEKGECENPSHRGEFAASALAFHSFLDGLGIGLAFKVSPGVGWAVTAGVLAHDFSDGINTVSVILRSRGSRKEAFRWLIVDALAPFLGVVVTLFFTVPQSTLGLMLAVFAGLFLYIGASDLIPESHHYHPTLWTTASTVLGIAFLYGVTSLAR